MSDKITGFLTGMPGFAIAGPWGTAVAILLGGAMAVAGAYLINPTKEDSSSPGQPDIGDLDINTTDNGVVINDVLGTVKVAGNTFHHCRSGSEQIREKVKTGGKGGGGDTKKITVGYKDFLTWSTGICMGPVDNLYAVFRNEDLVWTGDISPDADGTGTSITLKGMGSMTFFFGTDGQVAPALLDAYLTNNPAHKGLCWAFFRDCYLGNQNRAPVMRFIVKKTPTFSWHNNGYELVSTYEYSVAAGIYYILKELGFEDSWMHEASFSEVCDSLSNQGGGEDAGMVALLSQEQGGLTYLESIVAHFGLVMRYDMDGKLHLKSIRSEATAGLPEITEETDCLEPMTITRHTWVEQINEIKVQYSERIMDEGS